MSICIFVIVYFLYMYMYNKHAKLLNTSSFFISFGKKKYFSRNTFKYFFITVHYTDTTFGFILSFTVHYKDTWFVFILSFTPVV